MRKKAEKIEDAVIEMVGVLKELSSFLNAATCSLERQVMGAIFMTTIDCYQRKRSKKTFSSLKRDMQGLKASTLKHETF